MSKQGRKDDQGKLPWHLLPWDAVEGIVEVLRFGAGKYGERNWERGIDYSRVYSALIRHLTAWWQREPVDEETGLSHLKHAGCCIAFLLAYEVRGMAQFDDRPRRGKPAIDVLRDLMGSDFDADHLLALLALGAKVEVNGD